MAEGTPESAISPVGPTSQPEGRRSWLPKISLPMPSFLKRNPKTEVVPSIAPTIQTADSVEATRASTVDTFPLNAIAPEIKAETTPDGAVANKVDADLTAQMAAHVSNPFPGAKPPEMASGFGTPTNTPTEAATVSPIAADTLTPTPIRTEAPTEPPTSVNSVEEPAA